MKWKGRRQSKHIEIRERDPVAEEMSNRYGNGQLFTPLNPIKYEQVRQEMGGKIPTPTPNPRRKKK